MNNLIFDVHGLELGMRCSSDSVELKKLFGGRKYSLDWVPRMVCHLFDDVLAIYKFWGNQQTVVLLELSEHALHSVVYGFVLLFRIPARYDSLTVEKKFTRSCLDPVTSQNRCTSPVCAIRVL